MKTQQPQFPKRRLRKLHEETSATVWVCDSQGNLLDQCLVCMDLMQPEQIRGTLECGHSAFCLQCIRDWANITNRCPLCSSRFHTIKSSHGAFTVEDKDQPKPVEDEPFLVETRCLVCGSDTDEAIMLLCDQCDNGFHTTCLGLQGIPHLEQWYCDDCFLQLSPAQQRLQLREVNLVAEEIVEQAEVPRRRRRLRKLQSLTPREARRIGRH